MTTTTQKIHQLKIDINKDTTMKALTGEDGPQLGFFRKTHGREPQILCPVIPLISWIFWARQVLESDVVRELFPEQSLTARQNVPNLPNSHPKAVLPPKARSLLLHKSTVTRGDVQFRWDPKGGFSFLDRNSKLTQMSLEQAVEFACIIVRDLATEIVNPDLYISWLPTRGEQAFRGYRLRDDHQGWEEANSPSVRALEDVLPKALIPSPREWKPSEIVLGHLNELAQVMESSTLHRPDASTILLNVIRSVIDLYQSDGVKKADIAFPTEATLELINERLKSAKSELNQSYAEQVRELDRQLEERSKSLRSEAAAETQTEIAAMRSAFEDEKAEWALVNEEEIQRLQEEERRLQSLEQDLQRREEALKNLMEKNTAPSEKSREEVIRAAMEKIKSRRRP